MKTNHVMSRWGGQIIEVTAVAHNADGGVGYWYFVGKSRFNDGSIAEPRWTATKGITFDPQSFYVDCSNPEAKAEADALMAAMNAYLQRAGAWHDMKHKRDGRCYSWSPKKPRGEEPIEKMLKVAERMAA